MRWRRGLALLLLGAAVGASRAGAQERIEEADLPRHVEEEVIAFFNHPATIRFQGGADIPGGRLIQGDVAVLGGRTVVAGEIDGDLVVVNGGLTLAATGHVTGDVTVLGGTLRDEGGRVEGQLVIYEERLAYEREGDRLSPRARRFRDRFDFPESYTHTRLSVRSEGNYNRVEGFPLMFGPVLETGGEHRFRADIMGVWRSDAGLQLDSEELGYFLRAEQRFGRTGIFAVGATAHSLVSPIERWGLTDVEASLATFLFHQDFRDYYEREGYSAYARFESRNGGLQLGLEYRDEDHAFVHVGSPWTLKRNDAPWRPQPLVAQGSLRSLTGEVVVDRRNDPEDPTDGWYLAARATRGLSGELAVPAYLPPEPAPVSIAEEVRPVPVDMRSGFLDLRRYARLGPTSDVRIRGVLAGSLDGEPLPPQFQHVLGGEGSLPGYGRFSLDCGARSRPASVLREAADGTTARVPVFGGYGCDRIALFQAEYRGSLSFDLDLGDGNWDDEWYPVVDWTPAWTVFFNAGRGWTLFDEGEAGYLGPGTDTMMDAGFGIFLGDLGLYWAWPLNGTDKGANFFIRVSHRF